MDARVEAEPVVALTHRQTMLIVGAVLPPVFLGSLDQTIVAGALPSIGRAFADIHSLPWLITLYLIASTATTPLYGKLADIHGRRVVLVTAILFYMAGALICALAPNMLGLILGRAVQGLGGGGLVSTTLTILGDIAAPKDRARYYIYYSWTYTSSGALGPVLGGFLADHVHWSAIFWLSIPLGLFALSLAVTCLGRLPRRERPHRLDFLGALLIVASTLAFLFALNLGGVRYPWMSVQIFGLAALALVLGAAFVRRLMSAPEPLVPLAMIRNRIARDAILLNTFGWSAIIALNIFLPMYLQTVMRLSPTQAGLSLILLMVTLNLTAGLGAWIIGRSRRYKLAPRVGLAVTIVAVVMLVVFADSLTPLAFELLIVLLGVGFGPIAPLAAVALQNAVPAHQFGISIGIMNFGRMLYAALLVAICGALVVSGGVTTPTAESFRWVFAGIAVSMLLSFVFLVLLEEKPLSPTHE